ncbi:MAG: hypothetical protein ABIJ16_12100 [Bacteroidota bacterium]
MLEIILIIWLSRIIGRKAEDKGHKKGWYIFMFVMFYIAGEIIGAFTGAAAGIDGPAIYLAALLGAGVGILLSFIIAGTLPDKNIYEVREQQEQRTLIQ